MPTNYVFTIPQQSLIIIAIVVFLYFISVTLFGMYFSKFNKNIYDFFYCGQRFSWWLAVASMVATGIGSYSYLKYSQQGYVTGLSSTMTYLNDWFIVPFFMFGWLPIIYFSKVRSIPEYFERRFNKFARYVAVIIILAYMLFYIGYNLYTMGVALEGLLKLPQIYVVPVVTIIIASYVTFGGQSAVIFTDFLQGFMLYLAGSIAILAGIYALGGLSDFWGYLPLTHRLPFTKLTEDPSFNTVGLFWGEALAGSIAFAFMNQGFLMRYLTIRSINEARFASVCNLLVTLPTSAVIVGAVGWIAKALITKQAAQGGVLEGLDPIYIQNTAHTFLIVCWETLYHNPILFGFVIAALTAALMSTVDTLINACAAIGIYDIYKPLFKPQASDKHYLNVARIISLLCAGIGLLLVIVFNMQKGTLMAIHYKGIMVIIPPIVSAIFLGVFWPRFNAWGACFGMIAGSIASFATLVWPKIVWPVAFLVQGSIKDPYMPALLGMSVTAIVGLIFSLITFPQNKDQIKGLTVDTIDDAMMVYKGGKPNFARGKKAVNLKVQLDSSIPDGYVSVHSKLLDIIKANKNDLLYLSDMRWWLGGLRSSQVKLFDSHDLEDINIILMSENTFNGAFLLKDKLVFVKKLL